MSAILTTLNHARRHLDTGAYPDALRLAQHAIKQMESRRQGFDTHDVEVVVDGLTTQALALRGLGDHERALGCLVGGIAQRLPKAPRLEDYARAVQDPQRRKNFLFGQLVVVEMALERLAPRDELTERLQRLLKTLDCSSVPLLNLYGEHLQTLILRASGGWARAVDRWQHIALRAENMLAHGAQSTGHPPAWYMCYALATLEAAGAPQARLQAWIELIRGRHEIQPRTQSFISGVEGRLGLAPPSGAVPLESKDNTLDRLEIDRWFSTRPAPTVQDARIYWLHLRRAPVACRISYFTRAIRNLPDRPAKTLLNDRLGRLLRSLPAAASEDYNLHPLGDGGLHYFVML